METNLLEMVGADEVGVMLPVSICMMFVVLLVRGIGHPASLQESIASELLHMGKSSDSTLQKFEGALMDALLFVCIVIAATYLIILLCYYRCDWYMKVHMCFATFVTLAGLGGPIFIYIIQDWSIPVDVISFSIFLFNFTAVGILSTCTAAMPIVIKQFYMVVTGVIIAYWFTILPEWTTWMLIVALAVYDLVSVLTPRGPLNLLVNLINRRGGGFPVMVYECRPSTVPYPLSDNSNNCNYVAAPSLEITAPTSEGSNPSDVSTDVQGDEADRRAEGGEEPVTILPPPPPVQAGMQLGLGDFMVYSIIVGRAAMYDMTTAYACYVAIILGLGCTIGLLDAIASELPALPALPISVSLGVGSYVLARLLLKPFVHQLSTKLLMF